MSPGLSVSMSYNMNKEAVAVAGSGGGQTPYMAGYGTHGTIYRQHTSGILLSVTLSFTLTLFFFLSNVNGFHL